MSKTKVVKCSIDYGMAENSGKWPCSVCSKRVGRNSIMCALCKKLTHKRRSGIKGRLKVDLNYRCPICLQGGKDEKLEESELFFGN